MNSIANFRKQLCFLSTGGLQTLFSLMQLIASPFRFAKWCWGVSCTAGRCVIELALRACEVFIGFALVAALLFGLVRTLFHPVFS